MLTLISEPELKSIGELQYSSDILGAMKKICDNFTAVHRNSSLLADGNGKDLGPDTKCNFFWE